MPPSVKKGFTLAYAEWTNAVREAKNSAEQTATGVLVVNLRQVCYIDGGDRYERSI